MGYTKGQLIQDSFNELGMASYIYDLQPEDYQFAARRLEQMIGEWETQNVAFGYPYTTNPDNIDLDDDSYVPPVALSAVILGLAVRLAPAYGKSGNPITVIKANNAFQSLANLNAMPFPMQYAHGTPLGQGNKPWRWLQVFTNPPNPQRLPQPNGDMSLNTDFPGVPQ